MKKKILVAAAVLFHGALLAQNKTTNKDLDEVIITASRTEQKQSKTGKVVTVIDQATLQNHPGKSLTEILNLYAGIFTAGANNAPGSNQELYFRGAATGNTLVLMDGIPLQDPSLITNTYDLNNINPDHIERIEILKGAQSTLWGSNAVAGVINIITKKGGTKSITPTATLAYGSYNTLRLTAGLNGAYEKWSYNASYSRLSTDGFSAAHDSLGTGAFDKDGLKQNSFQVQLGYQLSTSVSASLTSQYGRYQADADGAAYIDDYDAIARSKNFVNSIRLEYHKNKTRLHLVQSIIRSDRHYVDDSLDIGGLRADGNASFYTRWSNADYRGRSLVTDLYGDHRISKRSALVAGLQYVFQKTQQDFSSISNFGPFDALPVSSDSASTKHVAAYASYLLTDWAGFNLELGGRFNRHSLYGSNSTFTFNPSYNIDAATRVFVNISSGFNAPSLYQLYSEYGNRNLQPEQSVSYEIGVQHLSNENRNSFRIVAFKRTVKDLIVYFTDPETFLSTYINRDEQKDYGFEIESDLAFGNWATWRSNFVYINGEGIHEGLKSHNLFRRPHFTVNTSLTAHPAPKLTLMPAFRWVGERMAGPYDVGGPDPMRPYYTLDFYAGYQIARQARVFIDLRNITDQRYFDIYGYNSRAFNAMAGVHLSF